MIVKITKWLGLLSLFLFISMGSFLAYQFTSLWNELPSTAYISARYDIQSERTSPRYVKFDAFPPSLTDAFLAAEGSNYIENGNSWTKCFLIFVFGKNIQHADGCESKFLMDASRTLLERKSSILKRPSYAHLAIYSMKLESALNRVELVEWYLNNAYFGQGVYGLQRASIVHFRTPTQRLVLHEQAHLMGMIHAPSRYVDQPQQVKSRRNQVIGEMLKRKYITNAEFLVARSKELPAINAQTPMTFTFGNSAF